MSYVKADAVLPEYMIKEIQKYIDGQILYIPRKEDKIISWGEKSGTRERMAKRNREIVNQFYSGKSISELGKVYFLSEKRIRGIIREYESSTNMNMEEA